MLGHCAETRLVDRVVEEIFLAWLMRFRVIQLKGLKHGFMLIL